MKFHSCITFCTTATPTTDDNSSPPHPPPRKTLFSDSSSLSTTSQDTSSSIISLQSNLSLLTLPSLPSLQKLSPEKLNISITTDSLTSLKPHNALVNFLCLNQNLLYAASGNVINVYEIINFTLVDTFNGGDSSSGAVKSISFSNGKIFTAHQDCKIRAWKLSSKKEHKHKHKLVGTLPTVSDRFRQVWLPRNYVKIRRHKKTLWLQHHDAISGLAVIGKNSDPDRETSLLNKYRQKQNLLHSVSWDKCLKIWDCKDMKCVDSIKAHDDAINAIVVSSEEGLIYTGSADRRIKVFGKQFGDKKYLLIATLEKHKSAVNALALNNDGSVLFSGSNDRSILVWEREDSANHMVVTGALRGHSMAILCLINVSDLLFSGSADRTVRIWQRGIDGRYCCLTVLNSHTKPIRSLVAVEEEEGVSGEANRVIKVFSGGFDGEIKVWQVVVSKC